MEKPELVSILKPLHDDYMVKVGEDSRKNRGYKHFHPSSYGECFRKTAMQYYSEEDEWYVVDKEIEPRVQRIFSAGHAFHYRMQYEFSEMGILRGRWRSKITNKVYGKDEKIGIFRPETVEEVGEKQHPEDRRNASDIFDYEELIVESAKQYNFEGHCDGVVETIKGDEDSRYVVDFKTVNGDKFKLLKEPDAKYVTQINIYMWLLDIKKGIIYYEDKNRHEVKEFLIHRSEDYLSNIKLTSKSLVNLLGKKQLPKIPSHFKKDKVPCKWCDLQEKCWDLAKK